MKIADHISKKIQLILSVSFLLVLGLCSIAEAQITPQAKELMIVHLKDGSKVEGTITQWNYEESLVIKTIDGVDVTFPAEAIEKVTQASLYKIKAPYNFKEKGLYYAVRAQYIVGNEGRRANETGGYGISGLVGHRFSRLLGVGLGAGYDLFVDNTGERLAPIFTELSGYFSRQNTTLSYSLAAGYAFAFTDADFGLHEAKGGFLIYPAIGFRFGPKSTKLTVDIGYKFQNAVLTYTSPWDGLTQDRHDILYKRLTLRMGLLF